MKNVFAAVMLTPYSLLGVVEGFITPLLPFFGLMVIVLIADLRFGIRAACRRHEKVRFSTAVRRTCNKFIDYTCWIFLAEVFDGVLITPLGIPLFKLICLLIVFGCELQSCFTNYFEERGMKVRINLFSFLKNKSEIIEINQITDDETKE